MSNKNIQGITIEIDGETRGLTEALKEVDKRSRDVSSELREVEKALKFNPDSVELLAQKQQLFADQVKNTTERLDGLRGAQAQVNKQFEKGDIGVRQYRAFERELIKTESQLNELETSIQSVNKTELELNGLLGIGKEFSKIKTATQQFKEELRDVDRALKLDPTNVELLTQRQDVLAESIDATSERLDKLRDADARMQRGVQSGEIGREQYRKFQREIAKTEAELGSLESSLRDISKVDFKIDALADLGISFDKVKAEARKLSDELKDVDKALKLDPSNVELLTQRQELLSKSVEEATSKLDELRKSEQKMQDALKAGDIAESTYRSFRLEIAKTETELSGLEQSLREINATEFSVDSLTGATKGFENAKRASQALAAELKDVDELLKLDPTNVDLLAQKQKVLRDSVNETSRSLDGLKNADAEMQRALKSGSIGEEDYRKFQREIVKTEAKIKGLTTELNAVDDGRAFANVSEDLKEVKTNAEKAEAAIGGIDSALAGIGAGVGIAGVVDQAMQSSNIDTTLDIALPAWATDEYKKSAKEAVRDLTAYGLDAQEAIDSVRRYSALEGDNGLDAINTDVLKGIATIKKGYASLDANELVQETREIGSALGISTLEATAMTNALLKGGFPPEQLDIIAEYGKQLALAGYEADEVQAILMSASQTDSWNIDNLLDGLKEGRIRVAELGQGLDEKTASLFDVSGIGWERIIELGEDVAAGGEKGKAAMNELAQSILDIEDATLRNEVGVKVFGTMWEDQGDNVAKALLGANEALVPLSENTKMLADGVQKLDSDPFVQLQQAFGDILTALDPLFTMVANIVAAFAAWASANPGLASTLVAIVAGLAILTGIFLAIAPIVASAIALFATTGITLGALATPIGIAIAAIVAIIAIVAGLIAAWEPVKAFFADFAFKFGLGFDYMVQAVSNFVANTVAKIGEWLSSVGTWFSEGFAGLLGIAQSYLGLIRDFIALNLTTISTLFQNIFKVIVGLVTGNFTEMYQGVVGILGTFGTYISEFVALILGYFQDIDLYDIGVQMLMGLVKGLSSMRTFVIDTVQSVIGGAIEGAKSLLDINSPSRVFEQIGLFTGEGLENGLLAMAGRVENASDKMVAGSLVDNDQSVDITASRGNSAGNNSGQGVINITFGDVHIANEQDMNTFSKKLAEVIDRTQRGRG